MKDLNAAAACRRAGYSTKNADKIGHQLLGKTRVQEKIQKLRDKITSSNFITANRILNELGEIAFARMDHYIEIKDDESLELFPYDLIGVQRLQVIETKYGKGFKIKMHNKVKALELLGKYFGLWEKKGKRKKEALSREENVDTIRARMKDVMKKRSQSEASRSI